MSAPSNGILWTSNQAAQAVDGQARGVWEVSGVSIDTRTMRPGDLFVAIKGPNFDGHDFIADALERGAGAVMASRIPGGLAPDAPFLIVKDTMIGLEKLGVAARGRAKAKVVGVTGSVGKTGTKEALRLVLGRQGRAEATEGNLNNHWGLPLSLARLSPRADFAVMEMGMNHAGELTPLSMMARPDVAIITTVAQAHSEHFESEEAIADAKGEIFAGLAPGGAAILNRDNPHFDRLAQAAKDHGADRIIGFGVDPRSDARLLDVYLEPARSLVVADILGRPLSYRIGTPGRHWVMNALAVLAAVSALGADVVQAAVSLEALRAPAGRGKSSRICLLGGDFQLIDESYNANPASMAASLDVLGRAHPGPGGRRIAVLGDMLELGRDSAERHAQLVRPLEANRIDLVFTAGREMIHLWDALERSMRGGHAANSENLARLVAATVEPGDVVMVKGSAGSRMGAVVRALEGLDAAGAPGRVVNGE